MSVDTFCNACENRGKCNEPCDAWYDELDKEWFGEGEDDEDFS